MVPYSSEAKIVPHLVAYPAALMATPDVNL
jgi:hypothetical protein